MSYAATIASRVKSTTTAIDFAASVFATEAGTAAGRSAQEGVSGARNRISFVTEDDNTDAVSEILWRAQVAHTSALSWANEPAFVSTSRGA